jgi:hypothetical protein
MFIQCHLPNRNDEVFLLYDKIDFDVEKLGLQLEDVQVIEPNKIMSEYDELPIIELNDFLLRLIKPHERTITHRLAEIGIESLYHIIGNKLLIDKKQSNLTRSQRDMVIKRYNDIINLINV